MKVIAVKYFNYTKSSYWFQQVESRRIEFLMKPFWERISLLCHSIDRGIAYINSINELHLNVNCGRTCGEFRENIFNKLKKMSEKFQINKRIMEFLLNDTVKSVEMCWTVECSVLSNKWMFWSLFWCNLITSDKMLNYIKTEHLTRISIDLTVFFGKNSVFHLPDWTECHKILLIFANN